MFLCHGAGNGGAERVITTLSGAFAEKGYDVSLVTTSEAKNDYVLNSRIHHTVILSNKGNVVSRSVDRVIQLRDFVKKTSPECIISFSAVPNLQAIAATIGINCRLIISERTDPSRYPTSKIGRQLRELLYPFADKIVFQTEEAKNFFPSKIKNKSIIIPNPVRDDLPKPYCGEREKKVIGVGSLGEQKNWTVALEAGKIFFKNHPDYTMEIFGEGPLRNNLQQIIDNDTYLKSHVFLRGFSHDVVTEMLKATMYVSSSDYEGISNAMLEALAVGLPSICTDCPVGGARENIVDGENGLLVPVKNPNKLAEAMEKVASNIELRQKFSTNAPEIRERLKLDRIVQMWEKEVTG